MKRRNGRENTEEFDKFWVAEYPKNLDRGTDGNACAKNAKSIPSASAVVAAFKKVRQSQIKGDEMSKLKDQGQASVLANSGSWTEKALAAIRKMKWGKEFALEDVPGIPPPRHPNAWGALATLAQQKDIILHYGDYRQSSKPSARGRIVALYWKV